MEKKDGGLQNTILWDCHVDSVGKPRTSSLEYRKGVLYLSLINTLLILEMLVTTEMFSVRFFLPMLEHGY